MKDNEIVKELLDLYPEHVLPIEKFPDAYCPGGVSNVMAIYLGCDPSNKKLIEFPYVFAHNSGQNKFNHFIKAHTDQLNQIGLNWNCVYTQNLCRNYFKDETSKNHIWKKVAENYWIDKLKDELSQFNLKIPVLLTSQLLLEVLGINGYEKILAPEFYESKETIPIPANKNRLNRDLIPMYRGKSPRYEVSYHLKNEKWNDYKNSIIAYLEKIKKKNLLT